MIVKNKFQLITKDSLNLHRVWDGDRAKIYFPTEMHTKLMKTIACYRRYSHLV